MSLAERLCSLWGSSMLVWRIDFERHAASLMAYCTGWPKSNATPVHTAVNVLYLRHFYMELAEILTMQQSNDSE